MWILDIFARTAGTDGQKTAGQLHQIPTWWIKQMLGYCFSTGHAAWDGWPLGRTSLNQSEVYGSHRQRNPNTTHNSV